MFRRLKGIHNSFLLKAKADPSVVFTEKLQMQVLEACKEKINRVADLPSALGAWTNFFYYSHLKTEEEMMTLLQDHPPVTEAYRKYRQFNQDEYLRALDEAHQRHLHDLITDLEEAEERGIVIGVDKGKAEIVRNMKRKGYSIGDIAEMTGLSYIEVERLN